MVRDRRRGEGGALAGIQRQGRDGLPAGEDLQGVHIFHRVDDGGPAPPLAAGGDGDVPAAGGGRQDILRQGPGGGGEPVARVHGDVPGVHALGGDGNAAAGEHVVALRRHIEVVQHAAALAVRHQEDLVGHRPLIALRGGVGQGGGGGVRRGDGQGRGAAAVQAEGADAAQLDEPRRHLAQARADGVSGLPAVNGVEDQAAVGLLAHRRPGGGPAGQAGHHLPVLHQGVEGAHAVPHVLPALLAGGDADGDDVPGALAPEGVCVVAVALPVDGEHHLALRHGGGGNAVQHLLHQQLQAAAHAETAAQHRADHVHPGVGGAGGALRVEVMGIEVDAPGGDPGLVDARDGPDEVHPVELIAQGGRDLDAGLPQHGAAVRPEADAVVPAVGGPQLPLGDDKADGQAVVGVEEIPVEPGHHPVALVLQGLRGGGDAAALGQALAEGHHGLYLARGGVGDEVLRPQVGVGTAPEHVPGQGGALVERRVLGTQVLAQGLGRRRGQRQRRRDRQRQQRSAHAPREMRDSFHCSAS